MPKECVRRPALTANDVCGRLLSHISASQSANIVERIWEPLLPLLETLHNDALCQTALDVVLIVVSETLVPLARTASPVVERVVDEGHGGRVVRLGFK